MDNDKIKSEIELYGKPRQQILDQWGLFHHPRNDMVAIAFTETTVNVTTRDGRVIAVPLDWFPWLRDATPEQRADYTLYDSVVDFNQLDNGFSMEPVLFGNPHLFTELSALPDIDDLAYDDDDSADSDTNDSTPLPQG